MVLFHKVAFAYDAEGCDTTIWFVNIYPGSEIYELEGHSALRVRTCREDIAINYGLFDFNAPNFVYRFVKGETDYMVGAIPWAYFENSYHRAGRRIVAHKLNLSSVQKANLMDLLTENLREENRIYRYNYVLDNCATRPLKIVERAIEDSILVRKPQTMNSLRTFRDVMRMYHHNYPWYQFGIDLALGSGIDRPISDRELTFAPVVLDRLIMDAKIKGEDEPLVSETVVINDKGENAAIAAVTPWYISPLFVMWVIFLGVSVWICREIFIRKRFPCLLATVVFFLFGTVGLLITYLVFVSVHEATSPNINLMWLNPLCFLPTITLWIKKCRLFNMLYFLINFVVLLVLLIIWGCSVQSPNAAFIPIVLTDMMLSLGYIYYYRESES